VPGVSALSAAARPAHLPSITRVGHKGADAVVAGNTVASFDAALGLGVDMIEFDVLRLADGRLVMAHDPEDMHTHAPQSLAEGLDHLAGPAFAAVRLDVDLKLPGYEEEVAEGLARRGLSERSLVSTTFPESLDRLGLVAPELERGWSVPRARRDYTRTVFAGAALGYLHLLRRRLPARAERMIAERRCEALMAYWRLVDPVLVRAVHRAGGRLFAWTVDDAERIRALEGLGVDGIITNDPRLFNRPSGPTV